MATLRTKKIAFLEFSGCTNYEAQTFADQYTLAQLRSLPYFQNLLRSRRLLRAKAIKEKLTTSQYREQIRNFYKRNGWITDGKLDVWAMLRKYRKDVIISGGDPSPGLAPSAKKGSHHKEKGVSKGDVVAQRKRAGQREITKRKSDYQYRVDRLARQKSFTVAEYEEKKRLEKWIREH
jgi:hypothetical protein